jgi:hypothetical protein
MERRQSPRAPACLPATLTLLAEPSVQVQVTVEDLSGAGARIRVPDRLAAGTLVQLVMEDSLYLGEVMYCVAKEGELRAGLALRHSLTHTKDLASLMRRLMSKNQAVSQPMA